METLLNIYDVYDTKIDHTKASPNDITNLVLPFLNEENKNNLKILYIEYLENPNMFSEYKNIPINIINKELVLIQILNSYHNVYELGKIYFDNISDLDTQFALYIYMCIYH